MNKNILGIIPARAGSKGVVGKNKRKVKNIPLIEYTINSAKESKKLTHIIISTDDLHFFVFKGKPQLYIIC